MTEHSLSSNGDLVSIITPAYKAAAYVGQCIESVLAQDYPHWEMLIVDDKSPDDTTAAIEPYAARDARVRLIRLERNAGPAGARNAALEAATGRYVAFLDSDDLWLPQKLRLQLAFMREVGAGLSYTAFRRISFDAQTTGRLIPVPPRLSYARLLGNTAIATSTAIVDRQQAGELRMKKTYYDDFVLWLGLLRNGVVARGLNVDLMRYRVVGQSVSRNKRNSALQVWKTYRDMEHLSLVRSAWCFAHYAARGWLKYRRF